MSAPSDATGPSVATDRSGLSEGPAPTRRQVVSWALWDWANQPFNSVVVTFVFTALYLTSKVFLDPSIASLPTTDPRYEAGIADLTSGLGLAGTVAGVLVALLAPVLGQRTDGTGRRKRALAVNTGLLAIVMFALFAVRADPAYFAVGAGLVALGSVFNEIAGVHYNAMLPQVSTPQTVGRVSGLGWGSGYLGGIIALVIVVVAYSANWFGLPQEDGLPFRLVAVGCAVWMLIFAIPLFRNVPELPRTAEPQRVGLLASYRDLIRGIGELRRSSPTTFWFLLASAVFRDGLVGIFTYGAVIGSVVFGFGFLQVVGFGVAANLVAGVATIAAGRLDDRFGAKRVIAVSLVALVVAGMSVFLFRDLGSVVYWIGGLTLAAFVGPAQAASRSFLARVTPAGREGEVFGLYATTGRAASFLSPALWTLFIVLTGSTAWGIVGLALVLAAGFVLLLFVREESTPGR